MFSQNKNDVAPKVQAFRNANRSGRDELKLNQMRESIIHSECQSMVKEAMSATASRLNESQFCDIEDKFEDCIPQDDDAEEYLVSSFGEADHHKEAREYANSQPNQVEHVTNL